MASNRSLMQVAMAWLFVFYPEDSVFFAYRESVQVPVDGIEPSSRTDVSGRRSVILGNMSGKSFSREH
jgi:hypothetical protein